MTKKKCLPLLLSPTIEIPRKFGPESSKLIFNVTVIIFKLIVESVIDEKLEVLERAGCRCFLRLCLLCCCLAMTLETLLCSKKLLLRYQS